MYIDLGGALTGILCVVAALGMIVLWRLILMLLVAGLMFAALIYFVNNYTMLFMSIGVSYLIVVWINLFYDRITGQTWTKDLYK